MKEEGYVREASAEVPREGFDLGVKAALGPLSQLDAVHRVPIGLVEQIRV